jgi:hypothetical protein
MSVTRETNTPLPEGYRLDAALQSSLVSIGEVESRLSRFPLDHCQGGENERAVSAAINYLFFIALNDPSPVTTIEAMSTPLHAPTFAPPYTVLIDFVTNAKTISSRVPVTVRSQLIPVIEAAWNKEQAGTGGVSYSAGAANPTLFMHKLTMQGIEHYRRQNPFVARRLSHDNARKRPIQT